MNRRVVPLYPTRKEPPPWLVEYTVTDAVVDQAFWEVVRKIPRVDHEVFLDAEVFEVAETVSAANVDSNACPTIVRLSPRQILATTGADEPALRGLLAHELAHAFHRHEGRDLSQEDEADATARRWVGVDVDAFRAKWGPAFVE